MKKIANNFFIEKENNLYTIRMTPQLQDDIGTIGFIDFTEDDSLEIDDIILNLEASKTVMGISSPLAGKIVDRNEAAIATPELLNSERDEDNWLVRLTGVDEEMYNALESV
ncbi:glycine cleavage system protein H [Streptococcus zalophi]|uniref:glycine cleavage system protein H n=1 Tax=Streptococcus zalophi TaxID=640031 RepID=UPI00215C1016|nr:glycine cleavage system protein H [Streptococcus zalophi]MCR8967245.1 glycine cleavage system protein H [Streptococcus zalophi]